MTCTNIIAQQTESTSGYLPSESDYYNSLPIVIPTQQSLSVTLPFEVDNTESIYFPRWDSGDSLYIYSQHGTAACQNIATVFYTFTYEINRLRNVASNTQSTRYVPNLTYAHLNGGNNDWRGATSLGYVQQFLKQSGAISDLDWDGSQNSHKDDAWRWPTGYTRNYSILENKLDEVHKFNMSYDSLCLGHDTVNQRLNLTLESMKHYLYDHATGDTANGGLITFGRIYLNNHDTVPKTLSSESMHAGERVYWLRDYNINHGHALTIVGYCDSVKFDWGGDINYTISGGDTIITYSPDGEFTNTKDNNGDGYVTMEDWEIGAFKVVNSYGTNHESNGYNWTLYSFFPNAKHTLPWWTKNGLELYALTPIEDYNPEVILKLKMSSNDRSALKLRSAYSYDAGSNTYHSPSDFRGYRFEGGEFPMQGQSVDTILLNDPMEFLLDFDRFHHGKDYGKLFFIVEEDGNQNSNSVLHNFSLMDYRWGEDFELSYDSTEVNIVSGTNIFSIEYDLIPHEDTITDDLEFPGNMVSRFNPVVDDSARLILPKGITISMYDSKIDILPGSEIITEDSVTFVAKQGKNTINIQGDAFFGKHIIIKAEGEASLDFVYANPNESLKLDSCIFINVNTIVEGKELEFSNTVAKHGIKNSIVVKCGAKLVLDNSLVTSSGNYQWEGIEVWGNRYASQYTIPSQPQGQGYLDIKNNSVVENAILGVALWKPNEYDSTGGIVYAKNSTFRNNSQSIKALYYKNFNPFDSTEVDYYSGFYNCHFTIDSAFFADEYYLEHVELLQVQGIHFNGCAFDVDNGANGITSQCHGIKAYNAGFIVKDYCSSTTTPCPDTCVIHSSFSNFFSAINAANDLGNNATFYVNNVDFIDNKYGVRALAVHNAVVLNSNFTLAAVSNCAYGIYAEGCSGFAFEENIFTKSSGAPFADYFGIYIDDSQSINEIYRNAFSGLSYGNFADGKNWHLNTYHEGLAYYCNFNELNYADFYVKDDEPNYETGIQSLQGSNAYSSGNIFSQAGSTWHFYNGGSYAVDYYHSNDTVEVPVTSQLFHVASHSQLVCNECESHYGAGGVILETPDRSAIESQYYTSLTDYNAVNTLYESYMDGGSTLQEINDIQTAQPSDMWTLRSQLLGDSPHLSFEVLKEAADKTDVLNESALFDILAANPDELKKDTLISYLENKEEPLPGYMISILKQLANGTTYKTVLQHDMGMHAQRYSKCAYDIIRSNLNESCRNRADLRNWLDNLSGIEADRQIIASYIDEENYSDAYSLLNMLPSLYDLQDNELDEHDFYKEIIDLKKDLFETHRTIFELDSIEKQELIYIADNSNGIGGTLASNILEVVYELYDDCCPDINGSYSYKQSAPILINDNNCKLLLTVKPNPATDWVLFSYILPSDTPKTVLRIYNAKGIKKDVIEFDRLSGQYLLDIRGYDPGIYFYQFQAGVKCVSGKIVIR